MGDGQGWPGKMRNASGSPAERSDPHVEEGESGGLGTAASILIEEVKAVASLSEDRVVTYDECLKDSHKFGGFLQTLPDKEAQRRGFEMAQCGRHMVFRTYWRRPDQPTKLVHVKACQQARICSFCAKRVGGSFVRSVVPKVLSLIHDSMTIVPGREWKPLIPYLLTLTQRTGLGWRAQAEKLWSHWARAIEGRRNYLKGGRHRYTPFAEFAGGIMAGEAKLSVGEKTYGEVHYHAHGVVLGRPYLTGVWQSFVDEEQGGEEVQEVGASLEDDPVRKSIFGREARWRGDKVGRGIGPLAEEWRRLLKYPDANLDLQPFKNGYRAITPDVGSLVDLKECYGKELQEVFRYTYKWEGMTELNRWEYFKELSADRIQERRGFGNLRGVIPKEEYVDDVSEFEGEGYIEESWGWKDGKLRLQDSRSVEPSGAPVLDQARIAELRKDVETWARVPERKDEF